MEIIFDKTDREEFETVSKYLQGKFDDLGKRKKETEDKPKQLLQMINTIERALALANEH